MNRVASTAKLSALFAALLTFSAAPVFAQIGGQRGMVEKKIWYVDTDKKIFDATYWRIYLGDYDVKLKRNIPGEGQVTIDAGMNFQMFSPGFIEGNGQSAKGKVSSLPGMRIVADGGEGDEIKADDIDYIFDYGTKVALKDGRKGNLMIGAEGGGLLEIKRFQLTEYKQVKGKFGELELKEVRDRQPVIGISFSKDGASRAASEAVTDY
jgi:hypothetical protein